MYVCQTALYSAVCACVCMCVCVCMYVSICVCINVCIMYVCVSIKVCMYLCSIYVCIYVSPLRVLLFAPKHEIAGTSPTNGMAWSVSKCAALWSTF